MRNYVLCFLAIAVLFSCQSTKHLTNSEEYKPLFNHKDLSGWTVHGSGKWYVENGDLVGESGPFEAYSYLMSESIYKDFELTLEFKQEATGNSGVFIRTSIDSMKVSGCQVEVASPGRHTGGIYETDGRGWLVKPVAPLEYVLHEGEWNTLKVRVFGSTVTTHLNGVKMVNLENEIKEEDGRIGLQIHNNGKVKVRWKNFQIRELEREL